VVITKERIAIILLTHENIESMNPTLRFPNVRHGALLVRAVYPFVILVMALVCSSQYSLGAEHDWYQCPVGKAKHLDLNKISLIRDSVVGVASVGSQCQLGGSASCPIVLVLVIVIVLDFDC
jgi:hypothetical protein